VGTLADRVMREAARRTPWDEYKHPRDLRGRWRQNNLRLITESGRTTTVGTHNNATAAVRIARERVEHHPDPVARIEVDTGDGRGIHHVPADRLRDIMERAARIIDAEERRRKGA